MKSFTNINPVFSENIQIVEATDPAHADNVNAATMQLLANTQVNKDAIEALKTSTGNTLDMMYNALGVYKIGDYCIYNNRLYKCISDIEEAEAWNKAHWEETTMTKELLALNNKEVEVVDPMTATEEGFAADAKLTGDALQALSANLQAMITRVTNLETITKNVTTRENGSFTVSLSAASPSKTQLVNFSKAFAKKPTIQLGGPDYFKLTLISVTTGGFTVKIDNTSGVTAGGTVTWLATC